jgi:hypothetical protein
MDFPEGTSVYIRMEPSSTIHIESYINHPQPDFLGEGGQGDILLESTLLNNLK